MLSGDQPKIVLFKDLAEQARVVRGGTIPSENDATVQHCENDPTVPMHLAFSITSHVLLGTGLS